MTVNERENRLTEKKENMLVEKKEFSRNSFENYLKNKQSFNCDYVEFFEDIFSKINKKVLLENEDFILQNYENFEELAIDQFILTAPVAICFKIAVEKFTGNKDISLYDWIPLKLRLKEYPEMPYVSLVVNIYTLHYISLF